MPSTIRVKAGLVGTHFTGNMRRSGHDLTTRRQAYELDKAAYAAFMADPSIEMEIVEDFRETDGATETVTDDVVVEETTEVAEVEETADEPEGAAETAMPAYEDITANELRGILKAAGLSTYGNKPDLYERAKGVAP